MGDGSTLPAIDTGAARVGGLTCWENTCRWPGSTCTPRASTCGSRPPAVQRLLAIGPDGGGEAIT